MKKSDQSKEHILNIATEIFYNNGFTLTSTKSLAKHMKVSEGLIFKHFGTKQGLLDAVISRTAMKFQADSLEVLTPLANDNLNGLAKLKKLLHNRYRFIKDNKKGISIIIQHTFYDENFRKELSDDLLKNIEVTLILILKQLKNENEIERAYNLEVALSLIKNLIYEMFITIIIFRKEYELSKLEEKVDTLIRGMN